MPSLARLGRDGKRRRFDAVVVWRLDRLGRNLKHLITLLDELQALGIAFVSLAEGIAQNDDSAAFAAAAAAAVARRN